MPHTNLFLIVLCRGKDIANPDFSVMKSRGWTLAGHQFCSSMHFWEGKLAKPMYVYKNICLAHVKKNMLSNQQ